RYQGGVLPMPQSMAQRALRLAEQAIDCVSGLHGFVGVDMVLGEDKDWAIEVNPRLTTSYLGLRALAKINLAESWLSIVRGKVVEPLEWKEGSVRFEPDGKIRSHRKCGA